jgi:hypothetical protein
MRNWLAELCERPSPVQIAVRDLDPSLALQEVVERGIIPVVFTLASGETELDLAVERRATQSLMEGGDNTLRVSGELVLDDVPVKVDIEVALDSMGGWGQVFLVEPPTGDDLGEQYV